MGKGDKKSARGKRVIGSSGVSRQKTKSVYVAPVATEEKAAPSPSAKATGDTQKKEAAPKKEAAKKPAASASAKATGDTRKKAATKKKVEAEKN